MDPRDTSRLDAAENLFFQRQLEAIDARAYQMQFPMLKGKMLVPKILGVGEYQNEYTYRFFETKGGAKVIANRGDDLPVVDATGAEFTSRIKLLGNKYCYGLQEIRAANATGTPLSDMMAMASRRGLEELIDELIANGSVLHQMSGFINNAAVDSTTFAPVDKAASAFDTWLNGGAPNATGPEMVADVNNIVNQVWAALKEAQGLSGKLTVVLPPAEYAQLNSTPMGDNADKTALSYLTSQNSFLAGVESWHKLTGAGLGGANRMICYMRDPTVLGSLVPLEWQPQPAQQKGLDYEVNCIARCGGTVIRYPVAVAYGDGI